MVLHEVSSNSSSECNKDEAIKQEALTPEELISDFKDSDSLQHEPFTQLDPNSNYSSEDESFKHEPLTQFDPIDIPPSEEDEEESPKQKPSKKNLKKQQKSVSVNSIFTVEELTSDDEIFTLQCPEKFNVQDLCDKNIDFSECKPTIFSKNEAYELELITSEATSISLAIPKQTVSSSMVNLPLSGHIVIKNVVDVPVTKSKVEGTKINDEHLVVFPNNIKVRHPLLGADWQAHIDLVNEAIKKKNSKTKKDKSSKSLKIDKQTNKLKRKSDESDVVVPKRKKHDL